MERIIVTPQDLVSINTMLYELICLDRWSEILDSSGKYTELAKQEFNTMIAYVWAIEAMHEGVNVDLTVFPKIAIRRSFRKTIQCDISEHNLDVIFNLGSVSKTNFDQMIHDMFSELTSKEFQNHLAYESDSLESKIYKGATKLATLIELEEIATSVSPKEYKKKHHQLQNDCKNFSYLPGYGKIFSNEYLEIFRDCSQIRNRIRWAKHPKNVKSTVLGHMFDVAVFSYLMSLEVNPLDEKLATQYFFMGVFHDFPEKWTGDMPSPIKDSVEGLREATEKFENQVMQENVYIHLPSYQVDYIKRVMLEDDANADFKSFLKIADTFSAFVECWREADAGSKHRYYLDILKKNFKDKEKLSYNFRLLMEALYDSLERG